MTRDIEVTTVIEDDAIFNSESENIATTSKCHRSYLEDSDQFGDEAWKDTEVSQTHGKMKDGSGFGRGISIWEPHCFPKTLLDKRNGLKVQCKKLNAGSLPNEFNMRNYEASIGGSNVVFTHYLLPHGKFEESVINNPAQGNLQIDDCVFEAGGGPDDLVVDFDDCERAVGPMYAGQCALKDLVNDPNNSVSDRCDALVLYAWLGSLEATIDELVGLSPWGSELILEGMKNYGLGSSTDSNYLLDFGDAVESLKYQLEQYSSDDINLAREHESLTQNKKRI